MQSSGLGALSQLVSARGPAQSLSYGDTPSLAQICMGLISAPWLYSACELCEEVEKAGTGKQTQLGCKLIQPCLLCLTSTHPDEAPGSGAEFAYWPMQLDCEALSVATDLVATVRPPTSHSDWLEQPPVSVLALNSPLNEVERCVGAVVQEDAAWRPMGADYSVDAPPGVAGGNAFRQFRAVLSVPKVYPVEESMACLIV